MAGHADKPLRAACLCGAVQLEVDPPVQRVGICHCVNCRRAQGAGSWTWATFAAEGVRVVAGADVLRGFVSDTGATRQFCSVCGSSLTYSSPRWPGCVDMSVANFEEPFPELPTRHSYADRAPAWAPIEDDLPRFGGPDGSTVL